MISQPFRPLFGLVVLFALLQGLSGCDTNYHPEGWEDPRQHGRASNLQEDDCRACHGQNYEGGYFTDISCNQCHDAGWKTDCNFCHGGINDVTGAPPRDIDGNRDLNTISFPGHPEHASGDDHAAYDCNQCHIKPTSALTPNHNYDLTPGRAEVNFQGLNPNATYNRTTGSCANLYCHGNGRNHEGTASKTDKDLGCGSCHADPENPNTWNKMSGLHARHLRVEDVTCEDCHAEVVRGSSQIILAQAHVDGTKNVDIGEEGFVRENQLCSGTCHGYNHDERGWFNFDGLYHPDEWREDETVHGPVALAQGEPCQDCHGEDLMGGTANVSCDSCHPDEWRTDCDYCHSPAGELGIATAFTQHSAHTVDPPNNNAFECDSCHAMPTRVLSPGHMFDNTPNRAEVNFTAGLSSAGTYNNGSCANLYCHGNGRGNNGSIGTNDVVNDCSDCHSTRRLSGEHDEHLEEGVDCSDCHQTALGNRTIARKELHLDGMINLELPPGITQTGTRCDGRCHGEGHDNERW